MTGKGLYGPQNGMWGRTGGAAAKNAAKTHCLKGHPFDGENTIWRSDGLGRECRACQTARKRAYRAKRRAMIKKYGSLEAYKVSVQANQAAIDQLVEVHKNEFNSILLRRGGYVPKPPPRICQADNCDNIIPDTKRPQALYCKTTCRRRAYRIAKRERRPEPPQRICQADNCDRVIPKARGLLALYCQVPCKRHAEVVARKVAKERKRNAQLCLKCTYG